ncbi:hypothetical protein [Streptomyces evansiae]|uniref:hypothetical protein n=1 Tax=Streptomyces evansiae TaxID=3075535 RepID=UPI002888D2FD|nr:hypothetical protein [Streptomyces sp. DSM 41859]MDT0424459.1 hypothetical protein [Streptomyces sp. DSM 41859]
MATGEEVREQLAERLIGPLPDSAARLRVTALTIAEEARHFTAVFSVDAPDGRWRVTLDSDRTDMNIFNGTPDAPLAEAIATSFRIRLAEWWHTKDVERGAARQGIRID